MQPTKIVSLSGGSGGYVVCRALRRYSSFDITAVASVFDSGGSTGILKDTYGELPKGDIRRCILGLLPEDGELQQSFERRYDKGPFAGHPPGNVLLSVVEHLLGRGEGIQKACKLLGTKGRVLPVSLADAELCAELDDGEVLCGETVIDRRDHHDRRRIKEIYLNEPVKAPQSVIRAIKKADYIVLAPGDLFTSLLPNLLVNGIVKALNNTTAKLVYVVNLMTKASETRGYTAEDFVSQLYKYGLTRTIDYLVVNSNPAPTALQEVYYQKESSDVVRLPESALKGGELLYRRLVTAPLLSKNGLAEGLIRHSSHALGTVISNIVEGRYQRNVITDLDDTLTDTTRHHQNGGNGWPPAVENAHAFMRSVLGRRMVLTAGNADDQHKKLLDAGFNEHVDDIFVVNTPEEKRNVLESHITKYPPGQTLVVDDRLDGVIPAANGLGYSTVRFCHPNGKYRDQVPTIDMEIPSFICADYPSLLDHYARHV